MINLSQKNVAQIAKDTGFIKDNVEKVIRLADLLDCIFSSQWSDRLVLKGGTAINFFYMNLPRLSVDIDFDYIGSTKEEMMIDKVAIRETLCTILFQKGYVLSNASRNSLALDSYIFQYINNAGNRDNIKIEINFLDRMHIFPFVNRKLNTLFFTSETEVPVLNIHELYGSKLAALISRCKPRDIYDVYKMIISNIKFDMNLLRKSLIFYNCISGASNVVNIEYSIFDNASIRDFQRLLVPMLSKHERFDSKKAIDVIKSYLCSLLVFTDKEISFINHFREGEYLPELLFSDEIVLNRIINHPMAQWRCKNPK